MTDFHLSRRMMVSAGLAGLSFASPVTRALAQGAENRVDADPQGLGRALLDAVKIIMLAGCTQAPVTLGTPQVIAGLGVDPVGADLDTAAALDAFSFVAPDPVLAQGILERLRSREIREVHAGADRDGIGIYGGEKIY